MGKRVYISADYSANDGDRDVVEELHAWGRDSLHKVDYVDTAEVVSGSVSDDPDCRACDLKREFNRQINASSAVIFIVGDKTACRIAGSSCSRMSDGAFCSCTPYKQNAGGTSTCKVTSVFTPGPDDDYGPINSCSYLRHEYEQSRKKKKTIIVVYNSLYKHPSWLPSYMDGCEPIAEPFWTKNARGERVGNYSMIKRALGYE